MNLIKALGPKNAALMNIDEHIAYGIRRALSQIKYITWHYNGNPGAHAEGTMSYFENEALGNVNSTFLVEGANAYQFLSLLQTPYTNGDRLSNIQSITLEFMHPDATGKFTPETLQTGIELTAYLLDLLPNKEIAIRHYDVTRKACPLWYAPTGEKDKDLKNARWEDVKKAIADYYEEHYLRKELSYMERPAIRAISTTATGDVIEENTDYLIVRYKKTPSAPAPAKKKYVGHTLKQIVDLVKLGRFGNNPERIGNLKAQTEFDPKVVQDAVDATYKKLPLIQDAVNEIWYGKNKYGNEPERTKRLKADGYTDAQIAEIRRILNNM